MAQRNILYTGPSLEPEQGQIHPEPCIVPYGGQPSFPQPNNNLTILPPSGTRATFNPQHLPENHGPSPLPHGITQFNNLDHLHHPANNIFMTPGARVYPVAMNHGMQDQLPFQYYMDVFKRKNAEGFSGNMQYYYSTPGSSSSSAVPRNTDGTMMDPVAHRSGRNRGSGGIGVDPVLTHSSGHLIPGNYGGQPIQTVVSNPWLDQPFCGNGNDGGAFSWNHGPGLPYLQGPINGSGIEAANAGLHGYQVTPSTRNPTAFMHPAAIQGPHNLHHPPPPMAPSMAPTQGPNMDFHSQLASTSRRLPTTTTVNPFIEPGPRFVGPTQPTGIRVFRPHRRELLIDATARHRAFPHLRVLPEDGVAILDISGYHEVGNSVDQHRDMRLDIDHMSYEELLALGEQIGSVGSGLSDNFILEHLKTRVFASSSEPEDSSSDDQEINSCVICQNNYDNQEQIGVLDCGHEYHVDCLKKWLTVKNTCPVCKATGLAAKEKGS
ncbi:putative E3 ubiquitin-protein ligase ZFP1 [Bidens hawaiensis]|uniref:putative E3 ubiquitin-protein ligase ZFP1 n=1 Tax=Bidens hawaiensis TaxID=980011 RepID=UPI00404991F1